MQNLENNEQIKTFQKILTQLSDLCQKHLDIADTSKAEEVKKLAQTFTNQITAAHNLNRQICIGIIGQVKAGKSSFLNALLFEGRDILPKAATPMTAALTILKYAEPDAQKAIVYFYEQDDFETIREQAKRYDEEKEKILSKLAQDRQIQRNAPPLTEVQKKEAIDSQMPEIYKAAHELITMSGKYSDNTSWYGKKEEIPVTHIKDLEGALQDYVGADGKYTARTKYVELFLNMEGLKDITVVDTPGMNDPIVSRGYKTKEKLKDCDVAFLLSYASQFLAAEDSTSLMTLLPAEGISRIYILGSKFDSVLLDEAKKYNNVLSLAREGIKKQLKTRAEEIYAEKAKNKNFSVDFVSAMLHTIAQKAPEQYSEQENHALNQLKKRYPDFKAFFENNDKLLELANIDTVRKESFQTVYADREKIFKEKLDSLFTEKKAYFEGILKDITDDIKDKEDQVKNGDIQALQKRQEALATAIEEGEDGIIGVFDSKLDDLYEQFNSILSDLKAEARAYEDVAVQTETETYTEMVKQDGLLAKIKRGAGSLFGQDWGYDEVTRQREVRYVDISNIISSIEDYIDEVNQIVEKKTKDIIKTLKPIDGKPCEFGKKIINIITESFNSDEVELDYDPKKIKRLVNALTSDISYPDYELDTAPYIQECVSVLGRGKTQDVGEAKTKLKEIIRRVIKDIREDIHSLHKDVEDKFSLKRDSFVAELVSLTSKETNTLNEQMQHREHYLSQYAEFKKEIEQIQKQVLS